MKTLPVARSCVSRWFDVSSGRMGVRVLKTSMVFHIVQLVLSAIVAASEDVCQLQMSRCKLSLILLYYYQLRVTMIFQLDVL